MSLINFNEIDFDKSIDKTNKIINFNGSEIQVVNYLSTYDVYDLIMVTLQKSFEDGCYNLIKINTYFNLHLIYMYTNIVFSAEDRADEVSAYDIMDRSGLVALVKEAIGTEQVDYLYSILLKVAEEKCKHSCSVGGALANLMSNFGEKLKNVSEDIKDIDPAVFDKIAEAMKNLPNLSSTPTVVE
jgi:hypothetical protein